MILLFKNHPVPVETNLLQACVALGVTQTRTFGGGCVASCDQTWQLTQRPKNTKSIQKIPKEVQITLFDAEACQPGCWVQMMETSPPLPSAEAASQHWRFNFPVSVQNDAFYTPWFDALWVMWASKIKFGHWVVLPEPVSPATTTSFFPSKRHGFRHFRAGAVAFISRCIEQHWLKGQDAKFSHNRLQNPYPPQVIPRCTASHCNQIATWLAPNALRKGSRTCLSSVHF